MRARDLPRFRGFAAIAFVGLLLEVVACASAHTVVPPRFPSRAHLERLASSLPSADAAPLDCVEVDRWELAGPFPNDAAAAPVPRPLAELIAASGGRVMASAAMQCAAREVGRFEAAHDAPPARDLRDFILGRCGALDDTFALQRWETDAAPASMPPLRDLLRAEDPVEAGLWMDHRGARTTHYLATVTPRVRLDEPPRLDAHGGIVLRGELLASAARLDGVATRGRLEVAPCIFDASIRLPRFAATCPVDRASPTTRVELSAASPRRPLMHTVLSAIVPASGALGTTFERVLPNASSPISSPQEVARELVALVNDLRVRRGVAPAEFDASQARFACRLAPQYVAAVGHGDPEAADVVALGLMAGWEVEGVVREGWFASVLDGRSRDLNSWLVTSLERPVLRRALLDPRASRLAPCPLLDGEGDVRGVLWSAYDTVQPDDLRVDLRTWVQRVLQRRAAEGLPMPYYDHDLTAPIDHGLERLQRGAVDLREVLHEVLADGAASAEQAVHGVVVQGRSGYDAELPSVLVEEPQLTMAVGGVYWRPADEPWARLVLIALDTSGRSGRLTPAP